MARSVQEACSPLPNRAQCYLQEHNNTRYARAATSPCAPSLTKATQAEERPVLPARTAHASCSRYLSRRNSKKKRRKKTASSSQSCHSTWGWLLLSDSIIRVTFRRPHPLGSWLVHDHRGVLANTRTSGTLSGQMNLNRPWPLSRHSTNYDRKSITTNPVYWNIFKHADKIRGIHFNALEANRIIT